MSPKRKRNAMTDTDRITKTIFIKASRETVWSFLTDKDKLGAWYHPAEADLAAGEDYALTTTADDGATVRLITGRVLTSDAPTRLVTTFVIGPFGGRETVVTWVLDDVAGGTRLTLTHDGIAEAAGAEPLGLLMALDNGWDEHLGDLRKVAGD